MEPQPPRTSAVWASGAAYEPYVGRWSRLVAREFLGWLAIPPGRRWLDVGCGTGAITQTILDMASPERVLGIDPSEGFLEVTHATVTDPRASFTPGNAMAIPADDASFDAVVSGLVLNFVPQPDVAAAEMARVTAPGGVVAVYVWDYAGQMQMMRYFWDAVVALNPDNVDLDESRRFTICNPESLQQLFSDTGLQQVQARAIDVPTHFRDFDDYWSPFLGGQGPAPRYAMSLSEEERVTLREHIRSTLPIAPDGSINLIARAWALRGTRPAA
jgi:SAM-dependent methyltransferase